MTPLAPGYGGQPGLGRRSPGGAVQVRKIVAKTLFRCEGNIRQKIGSFGRISKLLLL